MTQGADRKVGWAAAIASGFLLLSLWLSTAYWPGLVTWDSVRQYDQASTGAFDDWHPPVMEWLWRQLLPLADSPAPMLIVQLGLYGAGFAMLIAWALRWRRPALACMLGLCALLPISVALMGAVLKDCLMAGALMAATGLMITPVTRIGRVAKIVAFLLILFVATLRFNAFLAGVPLALALLPASCRARPRNLAAAAAAIAVVLLLAMPIANRLIHAKRSGVELSLMIFDLGGITEYSGQNAFPPLRVANPVAVNDDCYTPVRWDPYSWWVDEPCPIQFQAIRTWFKASGVNPYLYWLGQIARHPIAYAEHRLRHWNINARFIVADEIERPVQVQSAPNDPNFRVTPSPVLSFIDGAALWSAKTPLGWPCFWMALALGTTLVAARLPSRAIVLPLASSALLYGMGYAVLSVASELRYYLWTMIATAIAASFTLTEIGAIREKSLWLRWLGPAVVVTALAGLSRALGR